MGVVNICLCYGSLNGCAASDHGVAVPSVWGTLLAGATLGMAEARWWGRAR